jgi:hypothetical protein
VHADSVHVLAPAEPDGDPGADVSDSHAHGPVPAHADGERRGRVSTAVDRRPRALPGAARRRPGDEPRTEHDAGSRAPRL